MAKPGLDHIPALEGLKTAGVMVILLRHAAYAFNYVHRDGGFLTFSGVDFYPFWVNGWAGIEIFFALCGFLVVRSWLADPGQSYRDYVVRRLWRVLPAYYAFLALCYIGIPFYALPEPASWPSALYHLTLMQDLFLPDVNVVFGSLGAEIKFFILLPLLIRMFLVRRMTARAVVAVVAALMLAGLGFKLWGYHVYYTVSEYYQDYYMFFLHCRIAFVYCFEPVLAGAVIAWIEHCVRTGRFRAAAVPVARLCFWAGLGGFALWLFMGEHFRVITWYDVFLQPVLTATLIGLAIFGAVFGGASGWFGGSWARNGARLSYAAYLTHLPLIPASYALTLIALSGRGASLSAEFFFFFCVNMLLIWIASEALYHAVEKPLRNARNFSGLAARVSRLFSRGPR